MAFTALYDACVLFPAPVRDLLLHLAVTDQFRARWTDAIHEEWIRAVLNSRPDLSRERLERTRRLMDAHVRDALITDFEDLIPTLTLPDPDDRHVLAAAVRGRADVIVTYNLKDFPVATLKRYAIDVQHPDEFLVHLFDLAPATVLESVRRIRTSLVNPTVAIAEYLATLERHGLAEFADRLREYALLL
jgi:predicted nucleic acid-binding protein